jgi:hypothetical protein
LAVLVLRVFDAIGSDSSSSSSSSIIATTPLLNDTEYEGQLMYFRAELAKVTSVSTKTAQQKQNQTTTASS